MLQHVVDFFVVVEADATFQNADRAYVLKGLIRDDPVLRDFADRILVVEHASPRDEDAWKNEYAQRKAIKDGRRRVREFCVSRPLGILTGDVDEVPRPESVWPAIQWARKCDAVRMGMRMFVYSSKYKCQDDWHGTRAVFVEAGKRIPDMQHVRVLRHTHRSPLLPNSGWHLSSFGPPEQVERKLRAFSHTELRHVADTDIAAMIEGGEFIDKRHGKLSLATAEEVGDLPRIPESLTFTPV